MFLLSEAIIDHYLYTNLPLLLYFMISKNVLIVYGFWNAGMQDELFYIAYI